MPVDLDVASGRELNRKSHYFDLPEIEYKRQIVEVVSEEVGSNAEMSVDLYWNFNPETAEQLCRAIEPYDLAYLEDSLPLEEHRHLA